MSSCVHLAAVQEWDGFTEAALPFPYRVLRVLAGHISESLTTPFLGEQKEAS